MATRHCPVSCFNNCCPKICACEDDAQSELFDEDDEASREHANACAAGQVIPGTSFKPTPCGPGVAVA